MANINLSKVFKNANDIVSTVDSNILLDKNKTDNIKYSDIKLDFEFNNRTELGLNTFDNDKDLVRLINENSVITALKNIFNTAKCTRLLDPEIEVNLNSYLFEPLTSTKAYFIGYDICTLIPVYEPRVKVSGVDVTPSINDDAYYIKLSLTIPSLSKNISISAVLNNEGFVIGK